MPNEVIERSNILATQENDKWLDENLTDNDEEKPSDEFIENEVEDIGVIQFDDGNIAVKSLESIHNENEQPADEQTGDRNELERDDIIEQNAQVTDEEIEVRNELEIDEIIEQNTQINKCEEIRKLKFIQSGSTQK